MAYGLGNSIQQVLLAERLQKQTEAGRLAGMLARLGRVVTPLEVRLVSHTGRASLTYGTSYVRISRLSNLVTAGSPNPQRSSPLDTPKQHSP